MREGDDFAGGGCSYPAFPFLFGGTFIEGMSTPHKKRIDTDFPSFSEGLSLRVESVHDLVLVLDFPSFSEGLSLRG